MKDLTVYENSFTVYPTETNCMSPMIFGGAFFSQMDKSAATLVKRILYESKSCSSAVTHKFNGTFLKPCYLGDLIFLKAKVKSFGKKSITVEVEAKRENKGIELETVAICEFVFISIESSKDVADKPEYLPYKNHGLVP